MLLERTAVPWRCFRDTFDCLRVKSAAIGTIFCVLFILCRTFTTASLRWCINSMITRRKSRSTVGSWFTPSVRNPTASSSGHTAFAFAIYVMAAVSSFFVGSAPIACVTGHRGRHSMILSLDIVGFCVNMAPKNHVRLLSHFVFLV